MSDTSGSKHRPWMVVGIIAWVLIIAFVGFRMFGSTLVPSAVRRQVADLQWTQVSLPGDWHKPADLPPPAVLAYQEKFTSQMTAIRKKHEEFVWNSRGNPGLFESFTSGGLTNEQRTSFPLLMADLQPLIDETSRTVRIPGYTVYGDNLSSVLSFLELQTFAKLMVIVASEQARNGDCFQAMETAALPLRLVQRPEQSYLITHLIGIAITAISANSLSNLADNCTNTIALRRGLELMNGLRDSVFPGEIQHWFYEDLIALRFAAAYGYPVDLSPQPRAGFVRQRHHLHTKEYYQWIIDNFPSTDPKVQAAEIQIDAIDQRPSGGSGISKLFLSDSRFGQTLFLLATGVDPILVQHCMMGPNVDEALSRAYLAQAMYDLSRMNFSRRLAELDAAGEAMAVQDNATTATDLTAYLSTVPMDPFAMPATPFLYSATLNKDYSVGPDRKDDMATILYDTTNGTMSVGDIWMNGR